MANSDYNDLYNNLSILGEYYALDIFLDHIKAIEGLRSYEDQWKQYNPGKPQIQRKGLSLTSLDGKMSGVPDLDSLGRYNRENNTHYSETDFTSKTDLYFEIELDKHLKKIEQYVCRSHCIKFGPGGFFPPHRDLDPQTFRLFAAITGCPGESFVLNINNRLIYPEKFRLYFLDTKKEHHIFSFDDTTIILVLNILLNKETVSFIYDKLTSR